MVERYTNADIWRKLDALELAIGKPSENGDGGTGLTGEVLRMKGDVAGLMALKNKGLGLLVGVVLIGSILVLGLKQWFANLATVIGLAK